jgi:hypothetical protein
MFGDFASLARRRLARVWSSLLKVKMAASGTPIVADNQIWKERPAQGKWLLTGFGSPGYFLLAIAEEEELESWGNIVSDVAAFWLVNVKGGDGSAHEMVIIGSHLEWM